MSICRIFEKKNANRLLKNANGKFANYKFYNVHFLKVIRAVYCRFSTFEIACMHVWLSDIFKMGRPLSNFHNNRKSIIIDGETLVIDNFIKGRIIYYQVGVWGGGGGGRGRLYLGGVGFFFFFFFFVMYLVGWKWKAHGAGGSYISSGIWRGQMCSIGFCSH